MGETATTPEVQAGQFQNPAQHSEAGHAHGEIPPEERRRLETRTTPQLEAQLGKETDRLQQLMNQTKQLQKDLASKTEPEQIQIRERIGKLLDQIEKEDTGGARFGVDIYELRIEVARSIKMDSITDARSFLDKAKWATPSWKGFEAALREMDGNFLKGIGLLAKYISDLFYVLGFDRLLAKAPAQAETLAPSPAAQPARNPEATQQQAKAPENVPAADRLVLSLSAIEDPQTSTQDPSSIFFRAQIGTGAYELKIQPNGENLSWKNTKGEWKKFEFQGDENLSLIEYLKNHQQEINQLTAKIKGAENEDHVRSKLVVAMLKAQKTENTKREPVDILKIIHMNWEKLILGKLKGKNLQEMSDMLLNTPEKLLDEIRAPLVERPQENPQRKEALQEEYKDRLIGQIQKIEQFVDANLSFLASFRKDEIIRHFREMRLKIQTHLSLEECKKDMRENLSNIKGLLSAQHSGMEMGTFAFGDKYPQLLPLLDEMEKIL